MTANKLMPVTEHRKQKLIKEAALSGKPAHGGRKFGWARIHFNDLQHKANPLDYIQWHGLVHGTYQIFWCEEIKGTWYPVHQDDLPTINVEGIKP